MSVLIYIDHTDGHIKKSSLEALSYGSKLAAQTGVEAEALILGTVYDDLASLGQYGVKKVHQVEHANLGQLDSQVYAKAIADAASKTGATVVVFSNNSSGKSLAPRVAVRLKAGLVAGATALPDTSNGFSVKKNVFSGKAFATVSITSPVKVISLNVNAFTIIQGQGTAEVSGLSILVPASKIKQK